jgi:hypothetical protein
MVSDARLQAQDNQAAPAAGTQQTQQAPDTSTPSNTAPSQQPSPSSPASAQPSAGQPSDPAAATGASDSQIFTGTVMKQGDKYVLKDDAGKVYDIDHQDQVSKYEGKRVRVKGMLDSSGQKITVQ